MPHKPIVTRLQQIRTKYVQQSKEKRQTGKSRCKQYENKHRTMAWSGCYVPLTVYVNRCGYQRKAVSQNSFTSNEDSQNGTWFYCTGCGSSVTFTGGRWIRDPYCLLCLLWSWEEVWGEWRKLHNKEHHDDHMKKTENDGARGAYGEQQRCTEFWYKNLWASAT